uniref:Ribosomal protein S9 n=1 Tax=Nitzschia sp. NIES-3576 TaxID=2083273 RepID=A0A2Z5ZB97_9STRA|nr:ribosomal protein S9 [Nitzschia sp. NIES-3576]
MLNLNSFKKNSFSKILNIGKRKRAVAHVYLFKGKGRFIVNKNLGKEYFQNNSNYLKNIWNPLEKLKIEKKIDIIAFVKGSGLAAQSKAIQLGLVKYICSIPINKKNRKILKSASLLTRDSRIKERKKYGLKKARKASQYSKR